MTSLPPLVAAMVAVLSEEVCGARRTGPALEAMYRFTLWLVPTTATFPRNQS